MRRATSAPEHMCVRRNLYDNRHLDRPRRPITTIRAKMGQLACYRLSCITGPLSGGINASTRPVIRLLHGELCR